MQRQRSNHPKSSSVVVWCKNIKKSIIAAIALSRTHHQYPVYNDYMEDISIMNNYVS
ncbi:MAG: hypothetical protein RMY31_036035 [Dendronalium sp. ChiSLP03b]|nr:hypothetical protein [Dendronalium sp. ChiSLP03b]